MNSKEPKEEQEKLLSTLDKTKMVLVWRKDLKVRKGKMAAQLAHASLAVFSNRMSNKCGLTYSIEITDAMQLWLNESFKKIVVGCEDETELLSLYEQAKQANIPCVLITDAGHTEFKGIPTNTCIAIGPDYNEKIDKITSCLSLM